MEEVEDEEAEFNPILAAEAKEVFAIGSKKKVDKVGKKNWPHGQTIGGYHFVRDDSRCSPKEPPGDCYICTSPKHYARDCPHYGRWMALREAHVIMIDRTEEEDEEDHKEYITMLVEFNNESNARISQYEACDA